MSPRPSLTPKKRKSYNKSADLIFSTNLQDRRLAARLSQKELAAILGIDGARISEMEAGVFPASRDRIVALADALGCTCDELLRPKKE